MKGKANYPNNKNQGKTILEAKRPLMFSLDVEFYQAFHAEGKNLVHVLYFEHNQCQKILCIEVVPISIYLSLNFDDFDELESSSHFLTESKSKM